MMLKNSQTLHFLIPEKTRFKLEYEAFQNGVTMSWILRSLVSAYRKKNRKLPVLKRPRVLGARHVRFALVLYGNKAELLAYSRSSGGEFSSFIRFLLDEWMAGRLVADLNQVNTVKTVKSFSYSYSRDGKQMKPFSLWYMPEDYHPKNPSINIGLMVLGLGRRRQVYWM